MAVRKSLSWTRKRQRTRTKRGKDGEEKGKTKSPEERRKAFGELLRGEYADLTEELMQNA